MKAKSAQKRVTAKDQPKKEKKLSKDKQKKVKGGRPAASKGINPVQHSE